MQLSAPLQNRMTLRSLRSQNQITHEEYDALMDKNLQSSKPIQHINLYLLILSFVLMGAGIICLTAFNWLYLFSMQKLMVAEADLAITFVTGIILTKELHKEISFALLAILIGCFWAIFKSTVAYTITHSFGFCHYCHSPLF